ncbi:hypothetical protein PHYBLDRAFT_174562 [Phycomyces blakesleeanus NRRL 1555(-)]|uniref:Uncharacterized protein n=1 Tax=Phycomyces blakesleeanus (strain ATCC 8743b / DSM 1359 / FGSC 10004 / NBRC 33097 / NRRL 1555) TaxID=763407 RepID=A0A167K324_PHYB8|nr:hypothetical protein PHYBLDRAFT_174562 [Phycomyces blakesleeanus NRRL 1555(-)]OAD67176.1 hypothetical protein PHYBLDRAFT_174562 [Phycomyces blakesleeanus NRRL 1555(-)]|eukprot:XP_018285216.1 hypothetical protein PHYBLDRAFT_174562 [Phycomyces blakesleeanus NRRL 1555(-)]
MAHEAIARTCVSVNASTENRKKKALQNGPLFFATSLTHLKRNNIHIACPIRILTETLHFVRENDPILGVFDHIILWGCFLSSEALEILLKCKTTVSQSHFKSNFDQM